MILFNEWLILDILNTKANEVNDLRGIIYLFASRWFFCRSFLIRLHLLKSISRMSAPVLISKWTLFTQVYIASGKRLSFGHAICIMLYSGRIAGAPMRFQLVIIRWISKPKKDDEG